MNQTTFRSIFLFAVVTLVTVSANASPLSHRTGFLSVAKGPFLRDDSAIKDNVLSRVDKISDTLRLDQQLSMKLDAIDPVRVVIAKDGFNEDVIRNAIVLVEGDLKANLIQNSIVIVIGKVQANDIRGSVVASADDLTAYHAGGRDQDSLLMTTGQANITAAYTTTLLAEKGAKVQSPTHLTAINTKVRTPHPTRVRYQYVRENVLEGIAGLLSAN